MPLGLRTKPDPPYGHDTPGTPGVDVIASAGVVVSRLIPEVPGIESPVESPGVESPSLLAETYVTTTTVQKRSERRVMIGVLQRPSPDRKSVEYVGLPTILLATFYKCPALAFVTVMMRQSEPHTKCCPCAGLCMLEKPRSQWL